MTTTPLCAPSGRTVRARNLAALTLVFGLLATGCGVDQAAVDAKATACTTDSDCDASADTPCAAAACNPATGACSAVARPDNSACEDGVACTIGDHCKAGACVAGANLCECDADSDCKDDGNACNGTSFCNKDGFPYRCETNPATVVACPASEEACKQNACDPKTGGCVLVPQADGTPCDDGDGCTGGDACKAGKCASSDDLCACTTSADCVDADGDACNGVPYCDTSGGKGVCKPNPASVVECSTALDTACSKNICLPATGACALQPVADKTPCDDGDACTAGEICVAGQCAAGTDICKCTADADCKDQDDGNLCNGLTYCNLATGKCENNPATVVNCPSVDDTACSKNVCVPKEGVCKQLPRAEVKQVGCAPVDLGGGVVLTFCAFAAKQPGEAADPGPYACEDGAACTKGDLCEGTVCKPGTKACECASDADCKGKDDGNLCNGVLYCDGATGTCKDNAASVVYCDKSKDTECLAAACDPKTGACSMQPQPAGKACDDGEPCSAESACKDGGCVAGKATNCDDGDLCTADACKKGSGCTHIAKDCEDGNACTDTGCDGKTGACKNVAKKAGLACNADSDGCTVGDACDGKGACTAGPAATCNAKVGPCEANACQSKGADGFTCAVVAKADGTACPDGDACLTGSTCSKGSCTTGAVPTVFKHVAPEGSGLAYQAGTWCTGALAGGYGDGNGGLVVAGRVVSGAGAGSWRVRALGRDGKQAWVLTIAAPTGVSALGDVVQVLDRGGLGVLVLGRATRSGGGHAPVLAVVDVAGKLVQSVDLGAKDGWSCWLEAAGLHTSGGVLLAGRKGTDVSELRVSLRGLDGVASWTAEVPAATAEVREVRQFGQLAVSLLRFSVGDVIGYGVIAFDAQGKDVWIFSQGANDHVRAPIAFGTQVGDEVPFLVDVRDTKGTASAALWLRLDLETGGLLQPIRVFASTGIDAAGRFDGTAAWAARREAGGATLHVGDPHNNPRWQRDVSDAPADVAAVIVSSDAARIALLGDDKAGAGGSGTVRVVDRWGFGSCAARGTCAGKTASDCSDANDCTNDGCDAVLGCTHLLQTANICDPDLACTDTGACTTGSCVPSAYGRTFVVGYGGGETWRLGLSLSKGSVRNWALLPAGPSGVARLVATRVGVASGKLADEEYALFPGRTGPGRLRKNSVGAAAVALTYGKKTELWRIPSIGPTSTPEAVQSAPLATLSDPACASCGVEPTDLAWAPDGATYFAAFSGRDGGAALLVRAAADATIAWQRWVHAPGKPAIALGLAARGDGGLLFAGQTVGANKLAAFWGRVGADNGGYAEVLDTAAAASSFSAVVERKDGSVAVAGTATVGTMSTGVASAYSAAGALLWRSVAAVPDGVAYNGLLAHADGSVVLSGQRQLDGSTAALIERRAATGAILWQREHLFEGGISFVHANTLFAIDDGYIFGLQNVVDGNISTLVARTDLSGYLSCIDAGTCASKKIDACDDKDACTIDWCDAKAGCKHQKFSGDGCP